MQTSFLLALALCATAAVVSATCTDIVVTGASTDEWEYCVSANSITITNNGAILSASFPNLATLPGTILIQGNANLVSVSFPALTQAWNVRLLSNPLLVTLDIPAIVYVQQVQLESNALTSVSFPILTNVDSEMGYLRAYYEPELTLVSVPQLTYAGAIQFTECAKLAVVYAPAVQYSVSVAFQDMAMLTSAAFPVLSSTGDVVFNRCPLLTEVQFPLLQHAWYIVSITEMNSLTLVNMPALTAVTSQPWGPVGGYYLYYDPALQVVHLESLNIVAEPSIYNFQPVPYLYSCQTTLRLEHNAICPEAAAASTVKAAPLRASAAADAAPAKAPARTIKSLAELRARMRSVAPPPLAPVTGPARAH